MPATVKLNLKPEARQDKTHAVRIRITANRQPKYYSTGIFIKEKEWNPKATFEKKNWVIGNSDAGLYNRTIDNLLKEFMDLALTHPYDDAETLIRLHGKPKEESPDFLQFFEKELQRIRTAGNPRTLKRMLSGYNKLYEFCGGKITKDKATKTTTYTGGALPMEKLTVALVRNYVTNGQAVHKNSPETIKKELQTLSGLANLAIREGLLNPANNPFPHVRVKSQPSKKPRFNAAQLTAFETVELPAHRPLLAHVRDCFMLQYYLHGARVGDVIELRHENITPERVVYEMRKTGTVKSIKRNRFINAILERYPPRPRSPYVLPFLKPKDTTAPVKAYLLRIEAITAVINRALKEITAMAGIDVKISSHSARHTLADIGRKKIGIEELQGMLGHKNLKTTAIYTSELDLNEMDEADDLIYG